MVGETMSEWQNRDPQLFTVRHGYETEAQMEEDLEEAARHDWFGHRLGLNQDTGMFEVTFTRGQPMARPTEQGRPATDISTPR